MGGLEVLPANDGGHSRTDGQEGAYGKGVYRADEAIVETRRAALTNLPCARARPSPQHQRGYEIENTDLLRDAVKFTFSYLLCLSGAPPHLDAGRKS